MATQIEQIERLETHRDAGGVILNPPAKQGNQYLYWCFTFNNYDGINEIERLEHIFKNCCKWYIFQEETGEEKNTPHLQGTICLLKRQRLTELININPKIHWENTKSVSASIAYCNKIETRTGNIFHYGIDVPEEIELEEPYGWQLQIIDIIKEKPDKRTIHWFWEANGNVGKTTLCKYLVHKHDALMLTGKSNDMYHMISKYPKKRKLFIIDIPRSTQDFINYGAIEQIKNGLIFSGKYDGNQIIFNNPHVIVFANEPPNLSKMSKDRWNVINI